MKWLNKPGRILGLIIILFLALNPETLELALFINTVGFDIYLLLLEIQLLALGGLFIQYSLRPLIKFFLGFSMHSFIMPSWDDIRDNPKSLAHTTPPGALLMAMVTEKTKTPDRSWSQKVTQESDALDLEQGVFTWDDPHRIALSLKHSADTSTRRKTEPFRSAMSMLVFYINRAGSKLDARQKQILEQAKDELRRIYGKV